MLISVPRLAKNYIVSPLDDALLTIDHITSMSPRPKLKVHPAHVLTNGKGLVASSLSNLENRGGATTPAIGSALAADATPWEERLVIGDGMEHHLPALIDVTRWKLYDNQENGKLSFSSVELLFRVCILYLIQ